MNKAMTFTVAIVLYRLSAFGSASLIDLGTGDQLAIQAAADLVIHGAPPMPGRTAGVIIADTNRVCEIRIMFEILPNIPNKDILKSELSGTGQHLLASACETQIDIKEIPNRTLTMFYFELTDKYTDASDGRYMLQGVGTDGTKYLFQFVMLSNEKDSHAKAQIIDALSTMRIQKKD